MRRRYRQSQRGRDLRRTEVVGLDEGSGGGGGDDGKQTVRLSSVWP